jgi:hypothetical protein
MLQELRTKGILREEAKVGSMEDWKIETSSLLSSILPVKPFQSGMHKNGFCAHPMLSNCCL